MEEKIYTYPNAIIKVHIPKLSKEERNKRMERLKKTTQGLLLEIIKKGTNNDKDI